MSRIILSVETSSTICSAAIIENGEILSCVEEFCPGEHIEKLPGFVKKVFDKSNKTVNDIDAIAVSIGPHAYFLKKSISTINKSVCQKNKPTEKSFINFSIFLNFKTL